MRKELSISLVAIMSIFMAVIGASCLIVSDDEDFCGITHEMPGHKPVWIYEQCGPFDGLWIQQGTPDTHNGQALGSKSVDNGMVSFKFSGLHNRKFMFNKITYGFYFSANGFNDKAARWSWEAVNIGDGYLENRLVSQRSDVNCQTDQSECIQAEQTTDLQFYNTEDVYQWDCRWSTDDYLISCDVMKEGDANIKLTMVTDMLGPYNSLRSLGIGSMAYEEGSNNFDVTVTDFKVTIFD